MWRTQSASSLQTATCRPVVATCRLRRTIESSLRTFLRCIKRSARISTTRGGYGATSLRVQIGDVGLYRWLLAIGLHPRKSLTLGAISVPDDVFAHFVRGLLDGDGSIIDVTYHGAGKARGRRYRTLIVRFVSASSPHIEWLRGQINSLFGVSGSMSKSRGVFRLTFTKRASLALLPVLYPTATLPCLTRKRAVWQRFLRETSAAQVQ